MKIEIEKRLEEQNWLTAGDILSWIKKEFPIDKHLSYSQVENIVEYWRKKNNVYKESYILQHGLNKAGLPFFRTFSTNNFTKNDSKKGIKVAIWSSDIQINRLRLTNHWFVDGTFTIAPCSYQQLITIMIKDPKTGFVKPALWAVLSSKDEEAYQIFFRAVKDTATSSGCLDWTLASCTLDFEPALMNAFHEIYPDTRVIGCLFRFKQALFREAQLKGLMTDERKESTKEVIDVLGGLCWKGCADKVEKELYSIAEK